MALSIPEPRLIICKIAPACSEDVTWSDSPLNERLQAMQLANQYSYPLHSHASLSTRKFPDMCPGDLSLTAAHT